MLSQKGQSESQQLWNLNEVSILKERLKQETKIWPKNRGPIHLFSSDTTLRGFIDVHLAQQVKQIRRNSPFPATQVLQEHLGCFTKNPRNVVYRNPSYLIGLWYMFKTCNSTGQSHKNLLHLQHVPSNNHQGNTLYSFTLIKVTVN